jgi:hypothetical protein
VDERLEKSVEGAPTGATTAVGAVLLGAGAALGYLLWLVRKASRPRPRRAQICYVDVHRSARLALDKDGNVVNYERRIPIYIRDERRYGIKWIVNNPNRREWRHVHLANMRRDTKKGLKKDIFETGSDRAWIAPDSEQYFYSCILHDAEAGSYAYDIVVDDRVRVDPEIAIIRHGI